MAEDEGLLKLGLLFGAEDISFEEHTNLVSFQHRIIQEYLAAIYLTEEIKHSAQTIDVLFPTWNEAEKSYPMVVRFMTGLRPPILDCIASKFVHFVSQKHSEVVSFVPFSYLTELEMEARASVIGHNAICTLPRSGISVIEAVCLSQITILHDIENVQILPESQNHQIYGDFRHSGHPSHVILIDNVTDTMFDDFLGKLTKASSAQLNFSVNQQVRGYDFLNMRCVLVSLNSNEMDTL